MVFSLKEVIVRSQDHHRDQQKCNISFSKRPLALGQSLIVPASCIFTTTEQQNDCLENLSKQINLHTVTLLWRECETGKIDQLFPFSPVEKKREFVLIAINITTLLCWLPVMLHCAMTKSHHRRKLCVCAKC